MQNINSSTKTALCIQCSLWHRGLDNSKGSRPANISTPVVNKSFLGDFGTLILWLLSTSRWLKVFSDET